MSQNTLINNIASQARILGVLFYRSPENEDVSNLIRYMKTGDWMAEWCGAPETRQAIYATLSQPGDEPDEEAFQRLFIGPYVLPAPPWGSVYTDEESVLFGESTLELRQWMRSNAIAGMTGGKEPEDHFGLLLLLAAWVAEEKPDRLAELLGEHILPWGYRFLALMSESAQQPFYKGLAKLADLSLREWQSHLNIASQPKKLYR